MNPPFYQKQKLSDGHWAVMKSGKITQKHNVNEGEFDIFQRFETEAEADVRIAELRGEKRD